MTNRLKDKVAIITGASKGIGQGIAKVFAQEGAHVVVTSRTEDDLIRVVNDINCAGGKASYAVTDVTNIEEMEKMVQTTLKDHGRIDILIHNAGIYPQAYIEDMTIENWNHVINTSSMAALF
jgi:3-oxoacyl-[acyl-carrier protein] reductase